MTDTVKGQPNLEQKPATKTKTLSLQQVPPVKQPTLSTENLTTKDGRKVDLMVKSRRRAKTKTKMSGAGNTELATSAAVTAKAELAPKPVTPKSTADANAPKSTVPDDAKTERKQTSINIGEIRLAEKNRVAAREKTKALEERRQKKAKLAQQKETEARKSTSGHEKEKKSRHANSSGVDSEEGTLRKTKGLRKDRTGRLSRDKAFDLDEQTPRRRKARSKIKRSAEMAEAGVFEKPDTFVAKEIEIPDIITIGELAKRMSVKARDLIAVLFNMGVVKTINEALNQDTAVRCVKEIGHKAKLLEASTIEEKHTAEQELVVENGEHRAPVVTVMGHVDHGKTSLLDYIRKTKVASGEAGGITQHIGAYHIETGLGGITFLDTPGHADFTAMRARGTKLTDIVVLVIAVDDGVMPQTIEAILHAKKANVPIVTAITKIDLENQDKDIERIQADMTANDLAPEEWGGNTQVIKISAETGEGIKELLEAINLQAELLELKAVINTTARGSVIESSLDKGKGPMSTLLIKNGTLKVGDAIVAGEAFGRVRAMLNEQGQRIDKAPPSLPVVVLGFNAIPEVGDAFAVIEDEKEARELAEFRRERAGEQRHLNQHAARLDDMFKNKESSENTTMNLIIKTDVRGSLEAIEQSIRKLNTDNEEIHVNIIGGGVGGISESDALFAQTSEAVIFGFNVRADSAAKRVIEKYSLSMRYYSVIYELVDHLKVMLSELMAPELSEETVGTAEVRDVFNSQRYGLIAGCLVTNGNVYRNKPVRVIRDSVVIYEGELESLRRIKDDVEEVRAGVECGIGIRNYQDVRVGDAIENFEVKEIARTL